MRAAVTADTTARDRFIDQLKRRGFRVHSDGMSRQTFLVHGAGEPEPRVVRLVLPTDLVDELLATISARQIPDLPSSEPARTETVFEYLHIWFEESVDSTFGGPLLATGLRRTPEGISWFADRGRRVSPPPTQDDGSTWWPELPLPH
jgi:hypothetical protein